MSKDKEDEDPLLPTTHKQARGTIAPGNNRAYDDLLFKCYVIVSMTCVWTGYTLTVRHTRSTTPQNEMYASTTVVLSGEFVKLLITLAMLFREGSFSISKFGSTLHKHYLSQPKELAKMSVPSLVYALQNNLDFVALSNLDAGVYQVTTQLKVVTTALFMMAFLRRHFSRTRWLAIFLLFVGVAAVQMDAASGTDKKPHKGENYFLGITSVLATCVTAGFAGVYYEKMLKDGSSTPFWIRNLQMYSCGVIVTAIGCIFTEFDAITTKGFFYGYNERVYAVVGLLSVGGIYISLVMKHLDNLYKSFAAAISVILVVILSLFLFEGVSIGIYFLVGTATVCSAILLYNSVPE